MTSSETWRRAGGQASLPSWPTGFQPGASSADRRDALSAFTGWTPVFLPKSAKWTGLGILRRFLRKSTVALLLLIFAAGGIATGQSGPSPVGPDRALAIAQDAAFAHVFTEGAEVVLRLPADVRGKAGRWVATDELGRDLAAGAVAGDAASISLGKAAIGWFRIGFRDAAGAEVGWSTAAVLARASLPTRADSPVGVDCATAWFARNDALRQDRFATLAAMARVNWVRDRMAWGEAEPRPGELATATTYDSAADLQARHGLRVLQVFHSTPGWAIDPVLDSGPNPARRFPRDLRVLHTYCREMATRYRGKVQAWEPWNEANADTFGGHTTDEMCTLQKAAYLGFKAGDPGLIVGWNVYADSPDALGADLILGNQADASVDTFNVHSYSPVESYPVEFTHTRRAAAGKPIWISECGIHVRSTGPKPQGDLTAAESWRQACFIPASFATSLFSGVNRHFFFVLGNYMEGDIQFGLLREDMTPRPGYCALAAVGRFLDGATCLGRLPIRADSAARVVAFRAYPDGVESDVLVAWAASTDAAGPTVKAQAVYDCLGRSVGADRLATLGAAPVFAVLEPGTAAALGLEKPLPVAGPRDLKPSPVVLQAQFPLATRDLVAQAHRLAAGRTTAIPVFAYNFGSATATGRIAVANLPAGWRVEPASWAAEIPPLGRAEQTLHLTLPAAGPELINGAAITLRGDFGATVSPVLQFRVIADLATVVPVGRHPIAAALRATAWQDNIVAGGTLTHFPEPGGMRFNMSFREADPWSYPLLALDPADVPAASMAALRFTLQMHEGSGVVRVQFLEENRSAYIVDAGADAALRTPQTLVVPLSAALWGSWSKPDPYGTLRSGSIRSLMLGINAQPNSKVAYSISNLEWVSYTH